MATCKQDRLLLACSKDEEEEDEDNDFNDDDAPEVAVVCRSKQVLHLVVHVDHVGLCSVNIVSKFLDLLVLGSDLAFKVLGLVLDRLHNADNFVKLVVLVFDHLFLVKENLLVFHVASLVKLSIFSTLIPVLIGSLGSKSRLVVLDTPVLLGELALHEVFDIIDEVDAAIDFLFVDARVLVRLVLVIVHQLVEVVHVCLKRCPRGLHQVLLTGYRLPGPSIHDLIDLRPQTLNPFLCSPVVFLKLIRAHLFLPFQIFYYSYIII